MYTEDQVQSVLDAIGLDIVGEAGEDYIVFCPYHSNHRTPAGEVSKERGTFYCFSCGHTATLESLVSKVGKKSYFEAIRLINSKQSTTDIVSIVTKSLSKPDDFVEFDKNLINSLHLRCLSDSAGLNYLLSRNINIDSIKRFSIGYSSNQRMVTVPVHSPTGQLVGFVGRSIEGKTFKNSHNLPISKVLFNLHRVKLSPQVVVVESSFDAIRLDQVGLPAVATLGSGVSNRKIALLDKYFASVILVPDSDSAGEKMRVKLTKMLGSKLTSIALPPGKTDVGDLSDDHLRKLGKAVDDPLMSMI